MLFLSQLINGLQLGSIYALVALGYSMVYGIIMLLNFAHGDIIMMGGYFALVTYAASSNPLLAVVATIVGCVVLAVAIEKVAYKPLRQAPRISLLITAIGISLFLQNAAQLIWTANSRAFPSTSIIPSITFKVGGLSISLSVLVTIAVSVASMVALTFLVQKTKMGKAMRAVSEDTEAAQLMGININSTITFTFVIGSFLAGIGSVLYCCRYPVVNPTLGSLLGLKAFVAAVLGGIGSIPGAVVGGFAIGLAEVLFTSIGLSAWTDAMVFAVLIIMLLIKPTGFMGRSMTEKV
ncbi:MAG: branched-chain amino acid ABC transporter permease [Christensenellaceae bacterium]|jgi:branched-chain amino acid transport system permease protein|nr:branched-chain amino acid ABC transporter permease [Christensenellaceae bacterium]